MLWVVKYNLQHKSGGHVTIVDKQPNIREKKNLKLEGNRAITWEVSTQKWN